MAQIIHQLLIHSITWAIVYRKMGKYNDALQYYERSLKLKEQAYGSDHPSVAQTLNNMGSVYDSYGQIQRCFAVL